MSSQADLQKDDLQKLIVNHQRRLQKLKEQQSLFGVHVPPYIVIEIEDTEAALKNLQAQLKRLPAEMDSLKGSSLSKEMSPPLVLSTTSQVFIAYSRHDIEFVQKLAADLERNGFVTWWDVSNLQGGQNWVRKITAALEESRYCLVVLSSDSVKSDWVIEEYTYAKQSGVEVIPLLYKDCSPRLPLGLNIVQYVNFCGQSYRQGWRELLARLQTLERGRLSPLVTPTPALVSYPTPAQTPKTRPSGLEISGILFKAKLLRLARDPLWKGMGILVAVVVLAWTVYTYAGSVLPAAIPIAAKTPVATTEPSTSALAPTFVLPTFALESTNIPVPPTATPIPPSATLAPPAPTDTLAPTPTFAPIAPIATPTMTPTPTPKNLINDIQGVPMALVPAGEFQMGSESAHNERPAHSVYLDAFYIDQYEVTNAAYQVCVEAGICPAPTECNFGEPTYNNADSKADHPVVCVDWYDAKNYCEWREARLPTEAEWEKAARGMDGRVYPWGKDITCDRANYWGKDNGCVGETTPVGSYLNGVSPYGIYDMAGNVWEWVADEYTADYYNSPTQNSTGPQGERFKVVRGGAWGSGGGSLHASYRGYSEPARQVTDLGFRCVVSAPGR